MNKENSKRQMRYMKKEILSELNRELEAEISKPKNKRDLERICELNEMIFQLNCSDNEAVQDCVEASKSKLMNKIQESKPKNSIRLYKWLSVAVACAAVVVGLNAFSLRALGQNMFSAAYQFTKGGIFIDMSNDNNDNNIELPVTSDDPYGIKAKCAEYDMYPLTPTYIPEGFELVNVVEDRNEVFTHVIFQYKNDEIKLNFDFCQYNNGMEVPPIGIPTDTYNIVEEKINDYKMYILKEDNQFTATFLEENIVYLITAIDCDYDECQNVIESFV